MPESTPIVLLLDANRNPEEAAALAGVIREAGFEATILISGPTAETLPSGHPLTVFLKTLDVALADGELTEAEANDAKLFTSRFEKLYDAVVFRAGRLPSCYCCSLPPTAGYATLSEANVRAVMTIPMTSDTGAYFLGGRLHLPTVMQFGWLDSESGVERAVQQLLLEIELSNGVGPILVPLPSTHGTPAPFLGLFLKRLKELPNLAVGSIRQATDRLADIPYDHSIPMAAIQEMAAHAASGSLTPFKYSLGWLSPAEQLHILVSLWASALEKGRTPRNAQTRTPIPTLEQIVETTATMIPAADLPTVIAGLHAFTSGKNVLPTHVSFEGGVIAAHDLLPTLATSLAMLPTPADLPIVKGSPNFPPELSLLGRLAWTHKPIMP